MCVRVSQGNNVIIAMYVICICMSHVCIFVLYFALQIWRIIKYLSRPKLWKRDSTTVQPALYSMSVAPYSPTERWESEYNINSITITIV